MTVKPLYGNTSKPKLLFNILADNLENIFKTIENTNNDLKEF